MQALSEALPERRVFVFEETGSTNDEAAALAQKGAASGTVVVAEGQSAGRGRLGRIWESPPGQNILMSVVLRPNLLPKHTPLLSILSAVSCAVGIRELAGVDVSLKWPNDLLAPGGKLGGILLESRTEGDRLLYAIAGIGVNVNMETDMFTPEVRPLATSLLAETLKRHDRVSLAAGIVRELDSWLGILSRQGAGPVLDKWRELDAYAGGEVTLATATETVTGVSQGVDGSGRLVLRTSDGQTRTFPSGELLRH